MSDDTPKLQCPNCNQTTYGFWILAVQRKFDHQKRVVFEQNYTNYIRCAALDCGYTGKQKEFQTTFFKLFKGETSWDKLEQTVESVREWS